MENLKLGIDLEDGVLTDFFFDVFIMDGLFFTSDSNKVDKNRENFNLAIGNPSASNQISTNISKQGNITIITYVLDRENQTQFLVGTDLNINELKELSDNDISMNDKFMIMEAYQLL
jgi:hypothetical protein